MKLSYSKKIGILICGLCLLYTGIIKGQCTFGTVETFQKISDTEGAFSAALDDVDRFGRSITSIGDLNGDGVTDLVVGAFHDDDGGTNRGAVYVLFMKTDGTVDAFQKISDTEGTFTATLDNNALSVSQISGKGASK